MIADCPNCHAPVEFRFDDSLVRVCDHCHFAVVRTDRGVDTLGQFADLVPIESPLRLFADGTDRAASFLLVGMAQLRHAQGGLWQEWYAKLGDGEWGWLSEAQGRYYMTYEAPEIAAPPFSSLGPGLAVPIEQRGVARDYTVGELGSATYAAARGEIPYRLVPGAQFRFADLSAADGSFVTIDYGDPADPDAKPTVYAGRQMTLAELHITGGEPGPSVGGGDAKIGAAKIACPSCGGSLELKAPGQTLRVACPYCGTLVGVDAGPPHALTAKQQVPAPDLPLGSKCTFGEGEMQIIGFLRRSALLDGAWYPFDEYLLYAPAVGFRWLVQSDGHWSYVQPIAPGAVEPHKRGWQYDGVAFRRFQDSQLRVDAVLGEMYWRVTAGETTSSEDSIAPPAMLSVERSGSEENWSLSSYVTPRELRAALGGAELALPVPIGVAPNEPARSRLAMHVMSFGLLALVALGTAFALTAKHERRFEDTITLPSAAGSASKPAAPAPAIGSDLDLGLGSAIAAGFADSGSGSAAPVVEAVGSAVGSAAAGSAAGSAAADALVAAYFSPKFHLDGGENIELDFEVSLENDWAYAAVDLVEDKTGAVTSVDAELEHYTGFEDGEGWSEGDRSSSEMLGAVPAGDYLLRVEGQHGGAGGATLRVAVYQGIFRGLYLLIAILVLLVPYSLAGARENSREKQRWSNSTVDAREQPSASLGLAFWGIRLVFVALWGLIQVVSSLRSDND